MKWVTNSNQPDAQIGIFEKLAFMSGNVGSALVNTIVASFIVYYYTDIMLLNPAIIGVIMLVSRIFDGITDLIMGYIVDHTHSKHGKGRVWILRMCVPYAVSAILMMSVPVDSAEWIKYVFIFITYNLCNSVFFTGLYVPYSTLTVTMTRNPYERGLLGTFVTYGAVIGTIIIQSTIISFTTALGGTPAAWQKAVIVYALIGLLLHLCCFFFIRERINDATDSNSKPKRVQLKQELKAIFSNKYWLMAISATFMTLFYVGLLNGSGIYYAKVIFGNADQYAIFSNAMLLSQIAAMFLVFIPMKKFGKRKTMIAGFVTIAVASGIQFFVGASLPITVALSIIKGAGGALCGAVMYGVVADTIDYGEWKTGINSSGIGMAAVSFVTKLSGGLAGFMIGLMMKLGDYNPQNALQLDGAIFSIKFTFALAPMISCIVAAIIMLFYDLEKIFPQIQKELDERRN